MTGGIKMHPAQATQTIRSSGSGKEALFVWACGHLEKGPEIEYSERKVYIARRTACRACYDKNYGQEKIFLGAS